jgi:hypothetical protein
VTILRAQHQFQGDSGLPKDQFVNTFYFSTSGAATETDYDNIQTLLGDFWTDDPAGADLPLLDHMSGIADGAGASLKIYDMGDAEPRSPVRVHPFYYGSTGGAGLSNLPAEVAVCLSYSADPVSGIPVGSLRGRVYIGPLNTNCMTASSSVYPSQVKATFVTTLKDCGARLAFQASTLYDLTWGLWSAKLHSFHKITLCWVDNEFDTQRRRGGRATARESAVIA